MLWFGLHSGSAPAVEARVYMLWYHMLWWRGRAVGARADGRSAAYMLWSWRGRAVRRCAASVGVGRVFVPARGMNGRDGHPVRLCVRYGVWLVEYSPRGQRRGGVPKAKGGCFLGCEGAAAPYPRAGGGGPGVRDKG